MLLSTLLKYIYSYFRLLGLLFNYSYIVILGYLAYSLTICGWDLRHTLTMVLKLMYESIYGFKGLISTESFYFLDWPYAVIFVLLVYNAYT